MTEIDASENFPVNPRYGRETKTLEELVASRLSRRTALAGLGSLGLSACAGTADGVLQPAAARGATFSFAEIERAMDETHHVAEGYRADVLIRYFPIAPPSIPIAKAPGRSAGNLAITMIILGISPYPGAGKMNGRCSA